MNKYLLISVITVASAGTIFADAKVSYTAKHIVRTYRDQSIKTEYPWLSAHPKLNKLIKCKINKFIQSARGDAPIKPELKKLFPESKNEHTLKCVEVDQTKSTISLLFERFDFGVGAVHPNTTYFTINYDCIKQKELKLEDVLDTSKKCLDTLSRILIELLRKQKNASGCAVDEKWMREGAGPDTKNFSTFVLKDAGIEFIFQQYQVGPYCDGISRVPVL